MALENNRNNDYIVEIENLQNQIQELKDSKEKIIMSSDQEKSYVIKERKEIESLYNQCRDQKFELEKQLNALKQSSARELSVAQEKAKNDLNQKQNEINTITETLSKSEKTIDNLKKEIEKKEKLINEHKDDSKMLKEEIEKMKVVHEKQVHEAQVKFDIEKNALNSRLKESAHKLEEITNELNTLKQSQYMSTNNNGFNLEDVLEGTNEKEELQKQIEEKDNQIFQMKQEQKYYEKTINELKATIAKNKTDSSEKEALLAENKCLNGNLEAIKKQIEALKAQKEKDENSFKEEIKIQMDAAASAKCQLGMVSFEKEQESIKLRRYIKKLQAKLVTFGVVFGKKNAPQPKK